MLFRLFIFLGFLLFSVAESQIPLGSKLSVVENNYWVSSNGNFAIGFFNHSNQFSLGIHFNSSSIPPDKRTVVWVAGADLMVGDKSYFQLTREGELVLFDSRRGVTAWRSYSANSSAASAVLLNNGNFVLLNLKGEIIWQSFDNPTDTLLPGQKLSASRVLRAASRNSMSSYYTLRLNVSGQLQLHWESDIVYWNSGSPSQSIVQAVLNSDGSLQLLSERSKVVWSAFGEDHNDPNMDFRFLRLDVDGNLRLYSWVNALNSWRPVWQAVPNQCDVFATCGLRGICGFNASGSPICKCPFNPIAQSSLHCLALYEKNCKSGSIITPYEHTYLYEMYPPHEMIKLTSLQGCKSLCQEDPLCTAVTFMNDGTARCRILRSQYITGKSDPSLSLISYVKTCSDPIAAFPLSPSSSSSPPHHRVSVPCLIGVASGTFVLFLLVQFGIGFCVYKRRKYARRKATLAYMGPNSTGLLSLSYSEIKSITQNFEHQIGPKMFRGVIPNSHTVAVKDLKEALDARKFRGTVFKIGHIYHKNLIQLVGYCCELDHRFLVYEFAKSGSLRRCIEDPQACKRLTWRKRMEICLAVARAISYLHTGCREFVSHGNLKCENVVLDENFDAKVSEFGLVSDCGDGDVRNFGKMVVALVSGCEEGEEICEWAYEKWSKGRAQEVLDGRIESGVNLDELERVLRIAFWCLQVNEQMRPSMGEIVKVLEGTLSVDTPPSPFMGPSPMEDNQPSESEPEP